MERRSYNRPSVSLISYPELLQSTLPVASPNPKGEDPSGAEGKQITDVVDDDDEADTANFSQRFYPSR